MPELTLIQAIRLALDEILAADDRALILGHDVGPMGGTFRATAGLFEKYGPNRVIDAPPAGSATAGVAVGAALFGMHPICEIQFDDYIHQAFNQIVNEAARIHYRSNGQWRVPVVIRAPYGGGTGGGLYHSQSVEAWFAHVPGLKVVVASTPADARGLLMAAVADPNPVVFLEPKRGYRIIRGEVPENGAPVPLGVANVSREGQDVSVFSYGMMMHRVLRAAEELAEDGIDVEVVDVRTLRPLDKPALLGSVSKTGKALIVHEDNLAGGFGAELAAIFADEAFADLDAPVRRLAGPEVPAVPYNRNMQRWYMPGRDKIKAAVRDLAAY